MATVYVASIYPIEQKQERPQYGGYYTLPAVKRGEKPFVLEVTDKIYYEDRIGTEGRRYPVTERGENIARDIVGALTSNAPGMDSNCRPGIWIIGETPNYTAEQLAENTQAQENWLNHWIREVDAWDAARRAKLLQKVILPKVACQHLGIERDWAVMNPAQMTICPSCQKAVKAGAMRCEHCKEVIDLDAYAAFEARKHAAVQKAIAASAPIPVEVSAQPIKPVLPGNKQPVSTR
jgi:hypothetical protein